MKLLNFKLPVSGHTFWFDHDLIQYCLIVGLGGYHFLPNRGGHEKAGGSQNFFMRNRGSQKNQEIFGWLQILLKILFNGIAPKMHIFCSTRNGGYMFLQHCSSEGGHNIFDHQMGGGVTKILPRYFREIHDPPIPKKMVSPLVTVE